MPNILNSNGLQTSTQVELYDNLSAQMQSIYGADITLTSDSPDGQLLNLFIQSILDVQDLITQVYNQFDPDNAIGVVLDQRVAQNGIQRQAGTFTVTNMTIVTSAALNLYGLDQTIEPTFTVSDNAGNLWELQNTQTIGGSGTYVFSFQAALPGANLTIPNTITTSVTVVLGVTSVNNPTTYTTLGVNEESDAELKVRRQKSVSLASQGYLAALLAALENTPGVSSAQVYENTTAITDSDGIPGHSIWVIVAGSALALDIATAIYQKRNAGVGMKGDTSYTLTQVNGQPFTLYWDGVSPQNLFISFTASSVNGTTPPNIAAVREGLVTSFAPGVYQEVNINALATQVQIIDPNTLVTNAGFSTGMTQILTLSGVAASGTFKIQYNGVLSAAINWNDSIGTIQTKVQGVTGLSSALVTGSIATQILTFNLTALVSVLSLIVVTDNSLVTSGPVAITFAYNEGYSNTLFPTTKKYQFAVSEENILITPMILTPTTSIVTNGNDETFVGLGGYGTLVYSISINNSSGSINSSTGVYTAGGTFPVTDTIKVTDSMGNTTTATVSVV